MKWEAARELRIKRLKRELDRAISGAKRPYRRHQATDGRHRWNATDEAWWQAFRSAQGLDAAPRIDAPRTSTRR
jgi:hypothetical protein